MALYNTDSEFISELAREMKVSLPKAKRFIKIFSECIKRVLVVNGTLNIRKLGLFYLKKRKNSIARNIRTGEVFKIPLTMRIIFKPALSLKRSANERVRKIRDEKLI